jgi:plasmid stabilization system protein ParE
MSGYNFHPEVYDDIAGIWDYIAEDDPDAADRIQERFYSSISALVPFPHQGHWRTDLAPKSIRFTTVDSYLMHTSRMKSHFWCSGLCTAADASEH